MDGKALAVQDAYLDYIAIHGDGNKDDERVIAKVLSELDDIDIEISVMTPLQKVASVDEIQVGRDGLIISKGFHRGLLLPQVADEYGWDRETFIEQTCHKAGLPSDAWKEGADIFKFQAIVFQEG